METWGEMYQMVSLNAYATPVVPVTGANVIMLYVVEPIFLFPILLIFQVSITTV